MTRTLAPMILAAAISTALSTDSTAQGRFIDLGTVNPPNSPEIDSTKAYAISDDGRTVIGSATYGSFSDSTTVPFRWHATTGFTSLGTANGADDSGAGRVSSDGVAAFGSASYPGPQSYEPIVWESSTGVQRLDPTGSLSERFVVDVSKDRDRVFLGGYAGEALHFTRSTGASVTIQAVVPGGRFLLRACDDSGMVAIGLDNSPISGGSRDAFLWRDGIGTTVIPTASLGENSIALDVSPDGNLVLGSTWSTTTGVTSTWLYDLAANTTTVVDTFSASLYPQRMSADGTVIIYQDGPIWTPATGRTNLRSLLASVGASPPVGASSITPTAISPDGNSFAGFYVTQSAQYHAFVAYLAEPTAQSIGTPVCASVVANSTGAQGMLDASGSVLIADNDVRLVASSLPANALTLFVNSPTPGFTTNPGGSQGNLCLGGQIGRYNSLVTSSGPGGTVDLELNVQQTPSPTGTIAIPAGQTWYFQAWHRDANPTLTSNFTDAVAVTFE